MSSGKHWLGTPILRRLWCFTAQTRVSPCVMVSPSFHPQSIVMNESKGAAAPPGPDPKALRESREETVSEPGSFKNDPDEPTDPNEAIERSHRTMHKR